MKVEKSQPLKAVEPDGKSLSFSALGRAPREDAHEHALWADTQPAFLIRCFLEHQESWKRSISFVQLRWVFTECHPGARKPQAHVL